MIHHSHLTADKLKRLRSIAQWSQRDLAGKASVHIQTVKYWERQEGIIGGWAVDRFHAAFDKANISLPVEYSIKRQPFSMAAILRQHRIDISQPYSVPAEPEAPNRVICGAKNRKGNACKLWSVIGKKRCRFHGGLSTGPKTQAGRDRIREAQLKRWAIHKNKNLPVQFLTVDSGAEIHIHGV